MSVWTIVKSQSINKQYIVFTLFEISTKYNFMRDNLYSSKLIHNQFILLFTSQCYSCKSYILYALEFKHNNEHLGLI